MTRPDAAGSAAGSFDGAGPFTGLRIVELAEGVAGPYCGKLLADLGADVIKVEPPAGDATRRANGADPESSPLFLYCNTSKRGVVLDLDDEDDRGALDSLLGTADALIVDREPPAETPPDLIVAAVTPYGLTGPRSGAPAGELTLTHGGGLVNQMPARSRDIDRAPVALGGHQAGYHAGLVTALTVAALLYERGHGGDARVDVSMQDVMISLVAPLLASARYHETSWSRVPDRPPAMGRLKTSDGYVILNAFDDHHFELFRELMGNPDWCRGDEWKDMAYRSHRLMDIAPQVDAWALEQKRDDLYHRAANLGIPVGPIHDAADVMDYRQYLARDYFVEVDHPRAGKRRYAGWPYRMAGSSPRVSRPAPLLGEHSNEVRAEVSATGNGNPAGGVPPADPVARKLPLEGIRVAEFAWVWAGPYAGVLLSTLGAEVIKVEGPKRLDLTRRSVVWPRAEEAPRRIGQDAGMAFNTTSAGQTRNSSWPPRRAGATAARKPSTSATRWSTRAWPAAPGSPATRTITRLTAAATSI